MKKFNILALSLLVLNAGILNSNVEAMENNPMQNFHHNNNKETDIINIYFENLKDNNTLSIEDNCKQIHKTYGERLDLSFWDGYSQVLDVINKEIMRKVSDEIAIASIANAFNVTENYINDLIFDKRKEYIIVDMYLDNLKKENNKLSFDENCNQIVNTLSLSNRNLSKKDISEIIDKAILRDLDPDFDETAKKFNVTEEYIFEIL